MRLQPLRLVFGTRRGISTFGAHVLICFGLISGVVQLYTALWPRLGLDPLVLSTVIVAMAVSWGTWRAWPRREVRHDRNTAGSVIRVIIGDLFDQDAHLVIGFTDVFDTDTATGAVINPASVQGQFQSRVYDDDVDRLDRHLQSALAPYAPVRTELRSGKPEGKLQRYALGTVAVLGDRRRRFFCVAYAEMQNNLVAKSSVNHLWNALDSLWSAVQHRGELGTVAMPVIGTELARVNQLDRESLLKMILLSFIAQSRQAMVCKELVVVVRPVDAESVNLLEVKAFLERV